MSAWEIERNRTNVVCPDCAFSFDAIHQDGDGGYTCPLCESAPASGEPSGAAAVVREAWRSVTDSLPKPGADVIAGYRDTAGRWCSVRAVYAAERSVACTCERDGDCFCEMDDTGESWWPEGWYEIADNADDVNTWRIRGTVTHWVPLPTAPGENELAAEAVVREALDAIKKAHAAVDDLCNGRRWTMSIPARPDADHDLVIDDALTKAERVIRSLTDVPAEPHKVAALALYGQPFGFTWEIHDAIMWAISDYESEAGFMDEHQQREHAAMLRGLAIIASLLPPREEE